MVYQGSKSRIKNSILPIILKDRKEGQTYVEPFVGGCNSIDCVSNPRIGADVNNYLIAMWRDLQKGIDFPKDISRDLYNSERTLYKDGTSKNVGLTGYIGFNGSYGGRFFDGGYAGVIKSKTGKIRNYPNERYNNIMKQLPMIKGIEFENCSYDELRIPPNSIIYCDIPYKGTKQYKNSKDFDYDAFYKWCHNQTAEGHIVYISEYNMPDGFEEVWSQELRVGLKQDNSIKNTEKLYLCKGK